MKRNPPDGSGPGKYRIGAVSRMTGISAHSLRVWERRYPALSPRRQDSGGRLYSDEDVARFRLLRRLMNHGHSIGRIIGLSTSELLAVLAQHGEPAPTGEETLPELKQVPGRFLERVRSFELIEADQLLALSVLTFEPRQLVGGIALPLLQTLSANRGRGALSPIQAQAATALLQSLLGAFTRLFAPRRNGTTALVGAPDGLHPAEPLALGFVVALSGWRPLYLGPGVSGDDLADAAERTGARAVILAVGPGDASALEGLSALPPHLKRVLVGRRRRVPGAIWVPTASELEARLATLRTEKPSARASKGRR